MKCPGCSEVNEPGMQFCIFCGNTLAAPTPAPTPVPVQAHQLSGPTAEEMHAMARSGASSQMMVLVCTLCNKSDPLNGQFCVYCGGRTVAAPMPYAGSATGFGANSQAFGPNTQNFGPSSQNIPIYNQGPPQNHDLRHSDEFVRGSISTPAINKPAQSGGGAMGILLVFLALILGAAAGFGGIYVAKDEVQKTALKSYWPADGVVILSTAPHGDVEIRDKNNKAIVFGPLSAKGTLDIPSLQQGEYMLHISDDNGKSCSSEFSVNPGSASIIGYPSRLELK